MWSLRICVPLELHCKLYGQGHFGICKMKARARIIFYWSSLDSDTRKIAKSCEECAMNKPDPLKAQLTPWKPQRKIMLRVRENQLYQTASKLNREGMWYS